MFHRIYWDHFSNETYMYGTELTFDNQTVRFKNALIPSGVALKSWLSQTNFQANRQHPNLPLLKAGHDYRIELTAKSYPEDSIYMQFLSFDRYGNEIHQQIIKESRGLFHYPKEAYSYRLNLINAGCSEIEFHNILISDEDQALDDQLFSGLIQYPTQSDQLNVLFVEPGTVEKTNFSQDLLKQLSNVLILKSNSVMKYDLLTSEPYHRMMNLLQNQTQYYRINLIGYGPLGNFVAMYYGMILPERTKAYVTDNFYSEQDYKERLDLSSFKHNYPIKSVLERVELAKDIDRAYIYGKSFEVEDYQLLKTIFRSTEQLWQLPLLMKKGEQGVRD